MRRRLLLGLCLFSGSALAAETELLTLQNNPFSQPEMLKVKPKPVVPPRVNVPAEEVELKLTATLVSETHPMAMVDGELIGIGDKIEGMRLVAVREGKAVFARGGKRYVFEISDDHEHEH